MVLRRSVDRIETIDPDPPGEQVSFNTSPDEKAWRVSEQAAGAARGMAHSGFLIDEFDGADPGLGPADLVQVRFPALSTYHDREFVDSHKLVRISGTLLAQPLRL
jgi:hypothetical protein